MQSGAAIEVQPIIRTGSSVFREKFNRVPFLVEHSLGHHPLFAIPHLVEVAQRILDSGNPDKFVVTDFRSAAVGSRLSAMPGNAKIAAAIERLADSGSWLKLTRAQDADPAFGRLLEQILAELEELTGVPLSREITWATLTIFLSSPGIVTPFHMDHEANFLFQIEGEKDVCLFDPRDRELVPEEDVEIFYRGNPEAARFDEALQDHGVVYHIAPGLAVHHPPLAPHWVHNGDNVSVSASIGFCLRDLDRRAKVYQANLVLRQLGLSPVPPGRSAVRDWAKSAAVGLISARRPKDREELLFSGVNRLKAPVKLAARLRRAG